MTLALSLQRLSWVLGRLEINKTKQNKKIGLFFLFLSENTPLHAASGEKIAPRASLLGKSISQPALAHSQGIPALFITLGTRAG